MKLTEHHSWETPSSFWDYSKNPDPETFSHAAHKDVWWFCENGHNFLNSLPGATRHSKVRCRECRTLSFQHPDLARQWDYSRNKRTPDNVGPGWGMAHWICPEGHRFEAEVHNRVKPGRDRCPICSGGRVVPGINDLASQRPGLAKLFDAVQNKRSPETVWAQSDQKLFWRFKCGHSWRGSESTLQKHDYTCPYCANRKHQPGFNGLDVTHPEIARAWSKTNSLTPDQIFHTNGTIVNWVCLKCNHQFKRAVNSQVRNPDACGVCSGNIIRPGVNDMTALAPELLSQYDAEATGRPATEVSVSHKVYWRCPGGHSYPGTLRNMMNSQVRCNVCRPRSNLEDEVFEFCLDHFSPFKVIQNTRSVIAPYELDVYVPMASFAVEINGDYWHSDAMIRKSRGITADEYHSRKLEMCRSQGIDLMFVWETDWRKKKSEIISLIKKTGLLAQWTWIHTDHD